MKRIQVQVGRCTYVSIVCILEGIDGGHCTDVGPDTMVEA